MRDSSSDGLREQVNKVVPLRKGSSLNAGTPRRAAKASPRTRPLGRNDKCPCGSGKKYKKCCMPAQYGLRIRKTPTPRPWLKQADVKTVSPPVRGASVPQSLLNAGVAKDIVWAYMKTGHYIQPGRTDHHPNEQVAAWQTARDEYNAMPEADRDDQFQDLLNADRT